MKNWIIVGLLLIITANSVEQSWREGLLGEFLSGEREEENYRLIGIGCGKEKVIVLGMEEDEFPECEAIESLRRK